MKRLRGILAACLLLGLGAAGCQAATKGNFQPTSTVKSVQSAAPSVTAVNKVHTADYLGRWVSPSAELALYLDDHQNLAWFQADHTAVTGAFKLKLTNNDQATLSQAHLGQLQLTLRNATTMTLKHGHTTLQLTKDTGWDPDHGQIPTSEKVALKASTLAIPAPLKPDF